ncbi:MAG TPA: hypothetical protein VE709_14450 [Pseudonocardiaceae bacterium]|jgi:hypothetical protein|nr:hypothetical protein [Pseudonocardiaceae bacterium]
MDEQRLTELFRDAAGEAPPPSFGRDDVVAASRRATTRHRGALAGSSLLGVAVLTGGVLLGGQVLQPSQLEETPTGEAPVAAPQDAPGAADGTIESAIPFAAPPGAGTDAAPGFGGGCGLADAELAAALTATLGSGPGSAFPQPCPPGFRAAGVAVPGGTVYALLGPTALSDADLPGYATAPADAEVLSVLSVPSEPSAPPPHAADVDDLARKLADRL